MPTAPGAPPSTHHTPVRLARGFLTGAVAGASLAALVVGAIVESVPLFVTGLALPLVYGALLFLAGAPRRAREAAVVPRTALAVIETLEAVGGESSDVPVRFGLTVVPDDGAPFRVEFTQDVNLVELPDYRPRGVVVVQYPPDRPWRVRIVKRPTPEWAGRAASARFDAVPGAGAARWAEPPEGRADGLVALLGLLVGALAVVLLFRADLFGTDPSSGRDGATEPRPSASSTASTTVVSSASGTVTLGPGRSFLDKGELARALGSFTEGGRARRALTLVVQERMLTVVFLPSGTPAPGFAPGALPRDRFPALVEEAMTTLGVRSPRTWQITADRLTGSLVVRVVVTGPDGVASLETNGQGEVVRRAPVR
ncbi:hypothetical protein ACWD6K_13280 [Streptomyces sp. NPDC002431]